MGILDLRCMATGLPVLSNDTRCVFFYLRGSGEARAPMTLPLAGSWDGYTPVLDAGWHAAAVQEGLTRVASAGAITRFGRPLVPGPTTHIDLDIVAETLSRTSSAHVLLLEGEPVPFGVVLEGVYEAIVASRKSEGSLLSLPTVELCGRALPDHALLKATYVGVPEGPLREVCLSFLRWRAWFEASKRWEEASGDQFGRDEVEALVERALPSLRGHGAATDEALARALTAYRTSLPEDEPESEEDDDAEEAQRDRDAKWAQNRIEEHLRATLVKRPNVDPAALAQSVEMYRMLKNVSSDHLLDEKNFETNKARWRATIERVGMSDVEVLARALMESRGSK